MSRHSTAKIIKHNATGKLCPKSGRAQYGGHGSDIMKVTTVLPGCFHLQGPQSSALVGSPAEILKHLLRQNLHVPRVGIIPDVSDINGVSQVAVEFIGYWF